VAQAENPAGVGHWASSLESKYAAYENGKAFDISKFNKQSAWITCTLFLKSYLHEHKSDYSQLIGTSEEKEERMKLLLVNELTPIKLYNPSKH